jgi:hypothetical protein
VSSRTLMDEPHTRATGHSGNSPGQGPFMRITLSVAGGVVGEATYETYVQGVLLAERRSVRWWQGKAYATPKPSGTGTWSNESVRFPRTASTATAWHSSPWRTA